MTDEAKWVIGFGTDEWVTNFASGKSSGSQYVAGSILKRFDVAVNSLVTDAVFNGTGFSPDTLALSAKKFAILHLITDI